MKKNLMNTILTTSILVAVVLITFVATMSPRANAESTLWGEDISITIVCENEVPLYYGDSITLKADVEPETNVTWQALIDGEWQNVYSGSSSYTFTLTTENAALEYRVIISR